MRSDAAERGFPGQPDRRFRWSSCGPGIGDRWRRIHGLGGWRCHRLGNGWRRGLRRGRWRRGRCRRWCGGRWPALGRDRLAFGWAALLGRRRRCRRRQFELGDQRIRVKPARGRRLFRIPDVRRRYEAGAGDQRIVAVKRERDGHFAGLSDQDGAGRRAGLAGCGLGLGAGRC